MRFIDFDSLNTKLLVTFSKKWYFNFYKQNKCLLAFNSLTAHHSVFLHETYIEDRNIHIKIVLCIFFVRTIFLNRINRLFLLSIKFSTENVLSFWIFGVIFKKSMDFFKFISSIRSFDFLGPIFGNMASSDDQNAFISILNYIW